MSELAEERSIGGGAKRAKIRVNAVTHGGAGAFGLIDIYCAILFIRSAVRVPAPAHRLRYDRLRHFPVLRGFHIRKERRRIRFHSVLHRSCLNTDKSEIEKAVHEAGSQIIANKGGTFYGIAKCLSYITRAIIENRNLVLPISAPLDGQYGINDLYLGTPAIINSQGIGQVVEYPLTSDEVKKMQQSAEAMHQVLAKIEI